MLSGLSKYSGSNPLWHQKLSLLTKEQSVLAKRSKLKYEKRVIVKRPYMMSYKNRQAKRWRHLAAFSCSDEGIAPGGGGWHVGGGGVQYTCLIWCRLTPLDGYMPVRLVLTIDVHVWRQKRWTLAVVVVVVVWRKEETIIIQTLKKFGPRDIDSFDPRI